MLIYSYSVCSFANDTSGKISSYTVEIRTVKIHQLAYREKVYTGI